MATMTAVTLMNLGLGAADERFRVELERVIENIADVNTDPEKVREITLKVKIKPNQDRNSAVVSISCTSKLTPYAEHPTTFFMGVDADGCPAVFEHNPQQTDMFDIPVAENVFPLKKKVL